MSAIELQASAPIGFFDGRDPGVSTHVGNNTSSYTSFRIVNTYDETNNINSSAADQLLVVGPVPFNLSASTYAASVSTLFLCDSVSNAINVTMPPTPYPGMLMRFKDTTGHFATHNLTVTANAGQQIEQNGAPGTFGASDTTNQKGRCTTYQWDALNTHWCIMMIY